MSLFRTAPDIRIVADELPGKRLDICETWLKEAEWVNFASIEALIIQN